MSRVAVFIAAFPGAGLAAGNDFAAGADGAVPRTRGCRNAGGADAVSSSTDAVAEAGKGWAGRDGAAVGAGGVRGAVVLVVMPADPVVAGVAPNVSGRGGAC
ncbi:hypothetical protein [Tahibacter sp.]|uniref:hypothetical protein n=1 Tax=Tahibacter sp. TaxID=2056211 RepID=UPI0028C428F8|nr:hypothetical protein [Tahibacter sp.]